MEIVEPTDVDYASQTITAEFEDLSPVAVIANTDNAAAADTADRHITADRYVLKLDGMARRGSCTGSCRCCDIQKSKKVNEVIRHGRA